MTHARIPLSKHATKIYGHRFGRLVAVKPVSINKHSHVLWLCVCDCGSKRIISAVSLRSGNTSSCGCSRKAPRTHGLSHLPEWKPWTTMKYRCDNPNNSSYHKYGKRGIKVCSRWYDFELFMHDMGSKPTPAHSIERINNDGDYTPENCRWALPYEQTRNTRRNRWISYKGETRCVADWSNHLGINYKTLSHRLNNPKLSIEQAFNNPVRPRCKPRK